MFKTPAMHLTTVKKKDPFKLKTSMVIYSTSVRDGILIIYDESLFSTT